MPKNKQTTDRRDNPFKQAVENTPDISNCYRPGLQALENHDRPRITLQNPRNCDGSLYIEICRQAREQGDNPWDYAIGYESKVYFAEVHPATDGEIKVVARKLEWLKNWLDNRAPQIGSLKTEPYIWIMSGKCAFLSGSTQIKNLAKNYGLLTVSNLKLPL